MHDLKQKQLKSLIESSMCNVNSTDYNSTNMSVGGGRYSNYYVNNTEGNDYKDYYNNNTSNTNINPITNNPNFSSISGIYRIPGIANVKPFKLFPIYNKRNLNKINHKLLKKNNVESNANINNTNTNNTNTNSNTNNNHSNHNRNLEFEKIESIESLESEENDTINNNKQYPYSNTTNTNKLKDIQDIQDVLRDNEVTNYKNEYFEEEELKKLDIGRIARTHVKTHSELIREKETSESQQNNSKLEILRINNINNLKNYSKKNIKDIKETGSSINFNCNRYSNSNSNQNENSNSNNKNNSTINNISNYSNIIKLDNNTNNITNSNITNIQNLKNTNISPLHKIMNYKGIKISNDHTDNNNNNNNNNNNILLNINPLSPNSPNSPNSPKDQDFFNRKNTIKSKFEKLNKPINMMEIYHNIKSALTLPFYSINGKYSILYQNPRLLDKLKLQNFEFLKFRNSKKLSEREEKKAANFLLDFDSKHGNHIHNIHEHVVKYSEENDL